MLKRGKFFKETNFRKRLGLSLIVIIFGVVALTSIAAAEKTENNIVPVDPMNNEREYKELSAKWWQWVLSIPESNNPLLDETGEFCAEKQAGKVWFLAGTFGKTGVVRKCEIPAEKILFFPIINGECSEIEGDGHTENELRRCADALIDNVKIKKVTVDGKNIGVSNKYRIVSDLFFFTLPKDNILGLPEGSSKAVSDGYWIMLEPLSAGKHVIYIHGKAVFKDKSTFETEVTYKLKVKSK